MPYLWWFFLILLMNDMNDNELQRAPLFSSFIFVSLECDIKIRMIRSKAVNLLSPDTSQRKSRQSHSNANNSTVGLKASCPAEPHRSSLAAQLVTDRSRRYLQKNARVISLWNATRSGCWRTSKKKIRFSLRLFEAEKPWSSKLNSQGCSQTNPAQERSRKKIDEAPSGGALMGSRLTAEDIRC